MAEEQARVAVGRRQAACALKARQFSPLTFLAPGLVQLEGGREELSFPRAVNAQNLERGRQHAAHLFVSQRKLQNMREIRHEWRRGLTCHVGSLWPHVDAL